MTASLVKDLTDQGLRLEETHVSWVFLGERDVWKIKKPVSLGFLDYGTEERRREACEAETALNREFSPEVYRGVVPVTLDASGRHALGGPGRVVDWAVRMARLPESDRADRRLETGGLTRAHLAHIAERLAEFHAHARCDGWSGSFGSVEAITFNVRENFQQMRECLSRVLNPEQARGLEDWQTGFLRKHAPLFESRILAGKVRDGHGDLRLGQIYLRDDGGMDILDRVEFNDRFRYGDVCSDAAFLSMDLACRGRSDLAEYFLAAYAGAAGDFDLYALVDFYESYRACVRGKVCCYRAADANLPLRLRDEAEREARRHFLTAVAARCPPLALPRLTAVGGMIASGKSTLTRHLGGQWAVPVISSDRTRKQMAGLAPLEARLEKPWKGLYSKSQTGNVYAEMLRRARVILNSGRSVILDASFRGRSERLAAKKAAADAGAGFVFLECRASPGVCRERLSRRSGKPEVSDARDAFFTDFLKSWEPVEELPGNEHFIIDTNGPLEETLKAIPLNA